MIEIGGGPDPDVNVPDHLTQVAHTQKWLLVRLGLFPRSPLAGSTNNESMTRQ